MTKPAAKVLFVVIDQLRADCVHGALAAALDLPNLKALMADGVAFVRHYTVTNPCGPARASLLTSLYAMNHRSIRNGTPLDAQHDTIAMEVRKAGYEPLLFGYTDTSIDPRRHHPNDPGLTSYEGLMPGFTEVLQMRQDSNCYPWGAYLRTKGYALPADYWDLYRPVSPDPARPAGLCDPALYRAADSDTAFLTDQTIAALAVREHQNWFAHVTYIRPHPPLVAPSPYNAMYPPDEVPLPDRPATIEAQRAVHPFFDAYFAEPEKPSLAIGFDLRLDCMTDDDTRALRAVYFGLATEVDAHIGRLLDYLKDSDQFDDTLIVVTSDHGEMLGDHFMWGKQSVFDAAFHVPLIIRDPRRRRSAGKRVEAFTESIDVAPTILDWLGREPPLGFNGCSLLPFLEGRVPDDWRDYVFGELDLGDPERPTCYQQRLGLPMARCNVAIIRERRFKYVHVNGGQAPLLFDMIDDPQETRNLAEDPDNMAQRLRLSGRMLDHRMTHAGHALSRLKLSARGVVSR